MIRSNIPNRSSAPARTSWAFVAAFVATVLGLPVHANVSIPKVPLQSGVAVPPNIMFILDDSGSMQSEIMPDEVAYNVSYYRAADGTWTTYQSPALSIGFVYIRPDFPYGATDTGQYNNFVADPSDEFGRIARSSHFNKLYYNPAITYVPWAKSDGSLYANASPTCAPHNPENTGVGCRNLTVAVSNQSGNWQRNSVDTTCQTSACIVENGTRSYYPATYYTYNGTNAAGAVDWNGANYTERRILSTTASYTGEGRGARKDCTQGACTYAQEIQNFANWYTYYRSRILAARAGIGRAFSQLPPSSEASPAPRVGFAAINKAAGPVDGVSSATVIRGVREFSGTDRQNFFTSLYTHTIPRAGTPLRRALDDVGLYFSRPDNTGPWSKTPGTTNTAAHLSCRQNYSILMTDGYWNGDAASGGAAEDTDSAGMSAPITGPAGSGLSYQMAAKTEPFSDDRADTLADVAMHFWKRDLRTDLRNNVPAKEPNVAFWQHMVTYGVGLGVTGNVIPDVAFAAIRTMADVAWANPHTTNPGKIDDLLHAAVNSRGGFFNASNPDAFAAGLRDVLISIGQDTASGSSVVTNSASSKDADRVYQASYLEGRWAGELAAYPITNGVIGGTPVWEASKKFPADYTTRKIFTWSGTSGVAFPTLSQTTALTADVAAYVRGDRSNEKSNGGALRTRVHLLGDIVNSSPVYVKDLDTVFVGANDGMLHAFATGGDASAQGAERFAYVPRGIDLAALKAYAQPEYGHEYFVDGPIVVSSTQQTPNKRILVGTLGRGGRGLFALDVTAPGSFAANKVLWDIADTAGLGNVISRPVIAKLNNGVTGLIVANGPNSDTHRAQLFIFNLETGALIAQLDTKVGSSTTPNGLSQPNGWDVNGDQAVDFVYAGDLRGNLWKFDISNSNTGQWGPAYGNSNSPSPMFVAKGPGGTLQPITGGVTVAIDPTTYKRWVFFGTGRYLTTSDLTDKSVQSWYGLMDDGSMIGDHRGANSPITKRNINVQNSTDSERATQRAFEPTTPLPADTRGWFIDLLTPPNATAEGERMIGAQIVDGTMLVTTSVIPSGDECLDGGTGYINAVGAFTGTAGDSPYFDVDGDGTYETLTSGGKETGIGSVATPGMPGDLAMLDDSVVVGDHTTKITKPKKPSSVLLGRVSWREILLD
ncbi:pilus assembly protein [Cognatilysobacter bugurensis]|nr:PilC/PilY family type IV pilus protein [Lysobacter bugurensis]